MEGIRKEKRRGMLGWLLIAGILIDLSLMVDVHEGGRWFLNNLTKVNRRDSFSACPDSQDLIHPVPCIILWAGGLMEKRYSVIRRIVRIFLAD